MPWEHAPELIDKLEGLKAEFDQAVEDFLLQYPQYRRAWRLTRPQPAAAVTQRWRDRSLAFRAGTRYCAPSDQLIVFGGCSVLSQTCEYALRAATYIAQHADEGPVLAKAISEETGAPLKYLQKMLSELVHAGVLQSARGIGGGFRLNRAPSKVKLADVLAPFDDTLRRTTCPFGNQHCGDPRFPACPAHHRWSEVVEAYRDFLHTTTLRDLVNHDKH